jgi:hypothetical protein
VALRDRFLGPFAEILHIAPPSLDGLRMHDFAKLVLYVEKIIEHRNKQNQGG